MKKEQKKNGYGALVVIVFIVIVGAIVIGSIINKGKSKNQSAEKAAPQSQSQQKGEDSAENDVVEEFVSKSDDNTKTNTSDSLKKDKTYKGIKISNIQLTSKDNETQLLADAENVSGKDISDYTNIDIVLKDKDGNEMGVIPGLVSPLKAGEKTQLNASITVDYANAYDFEIREHKD